MRLPIAIGFLVLLLLSCFTVAWRPALTPEPPPPAGRFAPALVALGAQLAAAGNCAGCHTVAGGPAWGGGLGLDTGFGLAYSTNISPDPVTGIGNWSQAAFTRAMREGVARDGSHLLPVFPYTHFAKLGDEDVNALYAFFMTRPAVHAPDRVNTIQFPLNLRALQAGWKLLFFDPGTYRNVAARSEAWNRGAYLAEGITHCAACHTPRNRFGAEQLNAAYAGAPLDGWLAPPLDATNPAPVAWSQQDLYDYLRTGESERHGVAAGAMASVVHDGLARLPDSDVMALAIYFSDGNGSAARAAGTAAALALAESRRLVDVGKETQSGANLYLSACASCHYSPPMRPPAVQGSLALSTAIAASDPANFIQTVLYGVGNPGVPGPYMPGFATALSDTDIAQLASYLRSTRSDQPAWPGLPAAIAARRPPHITIQ
ncbi:cytochrome c [Acidovorax sp. A1169]|uniref:cytochrome c n=1 Tax=Acidovorax sp. A1169 TaxID=3059524 RepID=UPI002737AA38|nr:cytochrome c [Acidovorax sp. A1169]MDP4078688.1 cytochrome c [Acidovorax sp. A1169]